MRSTIVRGIVATAFGTGIVLSAAAPASAAPCVSRADCELQQEVFDGESSSFNDAPRVSTNDSFWEDVRDFLAGSGWDFW